ncbi:MAG: ABC transporter substrate-binding protein [Gemmatimonadaceae bacterium]
MPVLFFCPTRSRHFAPRPTLRLGAALCVSLSVLLQFAACGGRADATVNMIADTRGPMRDDFGRQVDLTTRPTRVVSLNPTTTEIIFAIGAQSRLIGRSHWDKWPAAAKSKPDLGDGIRPNVEQLIAAAPDVVILYATEANRDASTRLAHAGIATISLRINTVQQFDRATRLLARVFGDSLAGAVVADSVERSLARVRDATRDLPHPTVVWRLADRPPIVVGGGSFMNEMLQAAGATNLYAQIAEPSPVVSIEDIVTRDPDVVVIGGDIGASATSFGAWNAVPAVRQGKVISVSSDLVARPSVQMGAAAWALARALHPRLLLR